MPGLAWMLEPTETKDHISTDECGQPGAEPVPGSRSVRPGWDHSDAGPVLTVMNRREMLRGTLAALAAIPVGGAGDPFRAALRLSPSRTAAAFPVGVVTHVIDDDTVALLRALNVRHVRFTLYWNEWAAGRAYRRRFDTALQRAASADLDLLTVVHQPPDSSYRRRRETHERLAEFMTARVAAYPQVAAWQLYNEADAGFAGLDVFGARSGLDLTAQGREYAAMLRIVVPAMRATDPDVRVIANPCATGGREWATGVISGGGQNHFYAWSLNCYGFPVPMAVRDKVLAFRETIGNDPLWVTEYGMERAVIAPGWPASTADFERYHLEAWRDTAEWNAAAGEAERLYGYVLRGHGDFDLVRPDGSLRPAAEWLRRYNSRIG